MKLYGTPLSPYTMRVLLAARIKGQAIPLEPPPGGLQGADFLAISPMGRIPILADEDGWHLSESGAIVAYLDEALDGPALFPATAKDRARAREIIALTDIELGAGLRHFALQRMFCVCDVPDQLAYGRAQVAAALNALEKIGLGAPWAVGDIPGAADCALIPILAFADLMTDHFDGGALLAGHAQVERYWAHASADPLGRFAVETMAGVVARLAARRAATA